MLWGCGAPNDHERNGKHQAVPDFHSLQEMMKENPNPRYFERCSLLILVVAIAAVAATFFLPPIAQDVAYHDFADKREILGISNFFNVVSNVPFFVIGVWGLVFLRRRTLAVSKEEIPAFMTLFSGIALTGFGSVYYHLAPSNATLFWDRLPMTMIFMSLMAVIIGERISPAEGRWLLPIFLAVGFASVVYWRVTELQGAGDLRFYGFVQFFPVLAIPLIIFLYPSARTGTAKLIAAGGFYLFAKIAEVLDAPIFEFSGMVSGHTVKHLMAGIASYWLLLLLTDRAMREEEEIMH